MSRWQLQFQPKPTRDVLPPRWSSEMALITRINYIKKHRVFENLTWSKAAMFYMVKAFVANDRRSAALMPLDRLLHAFESDYHYLFKELYDAANLVAEKTLAQYYGYPNLARRLLESFLAFRYPTSAELYAKMQLSKFDDAKRTRIVRFLHTYSHSAAFDEQQHDPTMLAETPTILKELMTFIEFEDKKHYDEMVKIVAPSGKKTNGKAAGQTNA
jgi:wobble nucleotide-excising tRNase